jgi:hypothetical protein
MIAAARFTNDYVCAFDRVIPLEVHARPAELRAARHLLSLAAIAGVSAPLLTLMYHLLGYDAAGMIVLAGGLVMLVSPFTLNAGVGVAVARDMFIGALYVLKIWLAFHLGGLGAPTVQWFLLCPMIAMLVGGARPGLAWSAIVSLTVLAIFFLDRTGTALVPYRVADQQILNLVSILGLFALSTIIVLFFWAESVLASATRERRQ